MQKHHHLLVVGLVLAALVAIVIPAAAATNRGDVFGMTAKIAAAIDGLIDDQADIADRIEKLKVSTSTANQIKLAADARSLRAELEDLRVAIDEVDSKIGNLRLARVSSEDNSPSDLLTVSCKVTPLKPKVGDTVTFEANVTKGSSRGAAYRWSGDFTGTEKKEQFYFTGTGSFNAQLTVKNQLGETANASCPKVVVAPGTPGSTSATARATGAAVTVIGPTDNATLKIGDESTISWKHRGLKLGERLNISLRSRTGTIYFVKTSQMQGENGVGSYTWGSAGTTPNAFVPAGSYTLQVCTDDGTICGVSSLTLSSK